MASLLMTFDWNLLILIITPKLNGINKSKIRSLVGNVESENSPAMMQEQIQDVFCQPY